MGIDECSLKEFISFLKKNDAYYKFLVNVIKSLRYQTDNVSEANSYIYFYKVKKYLMVKSSPRKLIFTSFLWEYTLEGDDYWLKLNKKWESNLTRDGMTTFDNSIFNL